MKATYDPLADAVSIIFKRGKVARTKEVSRGVLLDVDKNDTPLYLEILDASKRFKRSKKDLGSFSLVPFTYSRSELASL
ncbi:hypothetical protein A2757_02210 [Candidatus Giovannonibacteria bacterium RIFCSPHIGHO2_01_FULL_48_47]|nr:MAG: hypothetical protein A2757_02210 [Candidatus Giovannonibacteria bacterium RIFCSPHIGHO2_01_FULL_48_47]OGF68501.1 MAG: hypothetical protein A3D61_02635 [Candidatus Giovannonibacteria bacterium RIFCSPHIGHO2_02_FULL_48_15]OGF88464.1 MAG: hypothetical protein A3B26_01915 [Candidatus Giovannonibacteria bacterium RIFCSPLOWO2_01_FULL_48_47]OGF94646.1 MAG: hypothetical protein A2433_02910 [Candidatus Giovannonibacteria bacterium RIFOXYC1_FULL_48_8]OGF96506.1 MAG: hypothetical protein A2613_03065